MRLLGGAPSTLKSVPRRLSSAHPSTSSTSPKRFNKHHLHWKAAFSASNTEKMADPATKGYKFNHTMIRIKDPKASIKFYTEALGMDLIEENRYSDFTLYFLSFDHTEGKATEQDKKATRRAREGILELTHNHGTESNPDFHYTSGNTDPGRGFGHIAVSVPDIEKACARLESMGVPFKKRLTDGKMRNIAFALDPDGYWVEIVPQQMKLHPAAPESK